MVFPVSGGFYMYLCICIHKRSPWWIARLRDNSLIDDYSWQPQRYNNIITEIKIASLSRFLARRNSSRQTRTHTLTILVLQQFFVPYVHLYKTLSTQKIKTWKFWNTKYSQNTVLCDTERCTNVFTILQVELSACQSKLKQEISAREKVEAQVLEVHLSLHSLSTPTCIDYRTSSQTARWKIPSDIITLYKTSLVRAVAYNSQPNGCCNVLDKFPSPGCCVDNMVLHNTNTLYIASVSLTSIVPKLYVCSHCSLIWCSCNTMSESVNIHVVNRLAVHCW